MSGRVEMGLNRFSATGTPIKDISAPSRRVGMREHTGRVFAVAAQGAWFLLAVTPVIVVVCALRG